MKPFRAFAAVIALSTPLAAMDLPRNRSEEKQENPTEQMKARLQGKWQAVKGEMAGEPMPATVLEGMVITIKGNRIIHEGPGSDEAVTFELNMRKSPAHIDVTDKDKKTELGIFRLDNDKFEVCVANTGDHHPMDFKSTKENDSVHVIFKRKKK
jgi:uncharacterized protein (TIGR03067 family)